MPNSNVRIIDFRHPTCSMHASSMQAWLSWCVSAVRHSNFPAKKGWIIDSLRICMQVAPTNLLRSTIAYDNRAPSVGMVSVTPFPKIFFSPKTPRKKNLVCWSQILFQLVPGRVQSADTLWYFGDSLSLSRTRGQNFSDVLHRLHRNKEFEQGFRHLWPQVWMRLHDAGSFKRFDSRMQSRTEFDTKYGWKQQQNKNAIFKRPSN